MSQYKTEICGLRDKNFFLEFVEFLKIVQSEKHAIQDPLILIRNVKFQLVDEIILYKLTTPTLKAYKTDGLDNQGKLVDSKKLWDIQQSHKEKLLYWSKKHQMAIKDVVQLDVAIRMKEARGHKWCAIGDSEHTRCFIICSRYYVEKCIEEPTSVQNLLRVVYKADVKKDVGKIHVVQNK